MGWFIAALAVPIFSAYAIVSYCDRYGPRGWATVFFRLSLAVAMGIGLASVGCFAWLILAGTPGMGYRIFDLTGFFLVGLLFLFLIFRRNALPRADEPRVAPPPPFTPLQVVLLLGFAAALAFSVYGAIGFFSHNSLGTWDAWVIWNQRARFIFRAGDDWRLGFSLISRHPDYPILIPLCTARLWFYLGAELAWAPWLAGVMLTFSVVGIATAGICRLRNRTLGLLAGLVLIGATQFVRQGCKQVADTPLSLYIIAAVALLVMYDVAVQKNRKLLVLAGLAAGMAAWTKNEGLMFILVLFAARFAAVWWRDGREKAIRDIAVLGAAAAPMIMVIALQKTMLYSQNDLVHGQGLGATLRRLIAVPRYTCIAATFASKSWQIVEQANYLLPLSLVFLGLRKDNLSFVRNNLTAIAVIFLMFSGYAMVYVTTPHDLETHLATSLHRLLMHLYPLCVFVLFSHLASPEELQASAVTPKLASCDSEEPKKKAA